MIIIGALIPPAFVALLVWAKAADKKTRRDLEEAMAQALDDPEWQVIVGGRCFHETPFGRAYFDETNGLHECQPLFRRDHKAGEVWIFGHRVNAIRHHSIGHTIGLVVRCAKTTSVGVRVEHRTPIQLTDQPGGSQWHFLERASTSEGRWGLSSSSDTPDAMRLARRVLNAGIPKCIGVVQVYDGFISLTGLGAYHAPDYPRMWDEALPFIERLQEALDLR